MVFYTVYTKLDTDFRLNCVQCIFGNICFHLGLDTCQPFFTKVTVMLLNQLWIWILPIVLCFNVLLYIKWTQKPPENVSSFHINNFTKYQDYTLGQGLNAHTVLTSFAFAVKGYQLSKEK